jgi:glycosyltransferase involved in cell wall biosynthesis
MRIWAFPSFYPFDRPGLVYTGIFAHRQYKGLIDNGADLAVVVPVSWSPPYPFSLLHPDWKKTRELAYPKVRMYDGIKVYHPRIANLKPNRFVKKSYEERYTDSILGFFKDNKITLDPATDIFYSQWLLSSLLVQRAARKLGVRSAVLSIGDDVVLWPNANETCKKLFEETWANADFRFTCADYLGKLGNKIIGKDLSYDVIRMGAQYDIFKPVPAAEKNELRKKHNIPDEKTVILTIGTASKRKGWIDLFDALEQIKKHTPDFLLIGVYTGFREFNFTAEIAKRGLEHHFLDMGEVAPRHLNKLYNAADIFCLPSHSEGIANVVIEAMSSGLPVITTNVCGHPELVNDGVTGILIPPQEPGILIEKLQLLLHNNDMCMGLGAAARKFIVNDWGSYAYNSKKLYEKLSKKG